MSHQKILKLIGMAKIRITEDRYDSTTGAQTVANTAKTPINALLAAPDVGSDIEQGVNSFLVALPPIMTALNAIGKVHPFINGMSGHMEYLKSFKILIVFDSYPVVVIAFQAAYTLDMTRRSNDGRVKSLFDEIEYMLMILDK